MLPETADSGPDFFESNASLLVQNLDDLSEFVPKKKLRRVDHFSRMALLAAGRALKDAGIALKNVNENPTRTGPEESSTGSNSDSASDRPEMGLIVASGFGALKTTFDFLDSYLDKGDSLASPTHFSNSLHNAAAAHIAICYGCKGPNLTVSQFDLSFISALITAGVWLKNKDVSSVLIGTSDAFCDVLGYCIDELTGETANPMPYRFSESAVFVLVSDNMSRAKYGCIENPDITRLPSGLPDTADLEIPVLASSMLEGCSKTFETIFPEAALSHPKAVRIGTEIFTPTGCSSRLAEFETLGSPIKYIKAGQDGRYGSFTFLPKSNAVCG